MNKYNLKELVKRIVLFFLGIAIIQAGVALFMISNAGSDPFTVFTQGLARTIGVTPGIANMIILCILFILIIIFSRKDIKLGTFITAFAVGPFIDLFLFLLKDIPFGSLNYWIRVIIVAVTCFIIAIGFSILASTEIGVSPNDLVPLIIRDKTNLQYRWIRITMDVLLLIAGFLLDGVVGAGTIVAALLIGPAIQLCLPYGEKFVNYIVKTEK